MYGAERRYNEHRCDEIPDITNTKLKPKLKIYPDVTKRRHHATEIQSKTDKQRCEFFNPILLDCKIL